MRALVTRPRDDAQSVTGALRARGFGVMVEPMLEIRFSTDAPLDIAGCQGILATSANGVRALAARLPDRGLPVWAVGDATARAARAAGWERVDSAGGDVDSLAELVRRRVDPARGPLFQPAGTVSAGDLGAVLARTGHAVRRQVLYEATTATVLSAELRDALVQGGLDVALFFSPRTAATFVSLIAGAGLDSRCATIAAHGLSPAVAAVLAPLPWRRVVSAARPTQADLLATLDRPAPPSSFAPSRLA